MKNGTDQRTNQRNDCPPCGTGAERRRLRYAGNRPADRSGKLYSRERSCDDSVGKRLDRRRKKPAPDKVDPKITNAGGIPVTTKQGAAFFDSQMSFAMIRGGHIDATVLGALQVDQEGNIANWLVPGVFAPGMGGAMDLVVGAKKVIVAMEHLAKDQIKILKRCTLPLTAAHEVDLIVTERCVLRVEPEGLVLQEINPLFSLEDITSTITADLIIPDDLLQEAV